jgi:lipopolysaccharide biosynthesis glycosyltransferase
VGKKIHAVCVCCFSQDLHLTRICVASIRYWYPEIPIYLLKDRSKGRFSTTEIESSHNVTILDRDSVVGGWGLTKLEAFFGDHPRRMLLVDSDTVFLGPVLQFLDRFDEDFVVTGVEAEDYNHRLIKRDYINAGAVLATFDPDYGYPGFGFNSGHIVLTRGIICRDDFKGLVSFDESGSRAVAPPGLFPYADQGILNYVLAKKRFEGIAVRYADFWCWPGHEPAKAFLLEHIRRGPGYPVIMHWAGVKRHLIYQMPRADILRFYNAEYYKRFYMGRLRFAVRESARLGRKVLSKLRKIFAPRTALASFVRTASDLEMISRRRAE